MESINKPVNQKGFSQADSSRGRKVTVAVIWRITERISSWMVLMDLSLGALGKGQWGRKERLRMVVMVGEAEKMFVLYAVLATE